MTTTDPTPPVRRRAKRAPNGTGRAPKRTIRVPDDEWSETDQIAAAQGDTMAAALRWGLEEYRRTFGP